VSSYNVECQSGLTNTRIKSIEVHWLILVTYTVDVLNIGLCSNSICVLGQKLWVMAQFQTVQSTVTAVNIGWVWNSSQVQSWRC
jgi:hypothetical protein